MADEEDLEERVKTVLKEKNAGAALELLTADDAYDIPEDKRNRLAILAISDAYVAAHYHKIIDLLSGDAVKKVSADLGTHGTPEAVFQALEDPDLHKQHATIVSAAISNKKIGIVKLYPAAIHAASKETKDILNTALGRDASVSNKELAAILEDSAFAEHRNAIIRHVGARMSAKELDKLFDDIEGVFSDEEAARWKAAVERKRKYDAEHGGDHGSSTHDAGGSDDTLFWVVVAIGVIILLSQLQ